MDGLAPEKRMLNQVMDQLKILCISAHFSRFMAHMSGQYRSTKQ
jgi:hypothetical protein